MPYRDTWATCEKCGKEFVFAIEQQRRLEASGQEVVAPAQCRRCQGEVEMTPGPHTGTVKWYDPEKGYGFVAHGPGKDIFFHRTGIAEGETPLFDDGTPVTYVIEESEKGPHAVNVARVGAAEDSNEAGS
ncbi:MAG: cold shock domain-containing protein [Anaerolineales bacterium]|nr:MAG: cold shock domain-containing protein [Anaerolineales bacterium]